MFDKYINKKIFKQAIQQKVFRFGELFTFTKFYHKVKIWNQLYINQ